MTSSPAEEIKQKLDIVEFLRGQLNLQPAGKNFKALCPFHKEKTPSFMVSPDRQSWHCFGCGLGGDIFSFVMRRENLEFGDALRFLAEKAGIELRRLSPAEYKFTGLLYDLNSAAKDFFRQQLESAPASRKYLEERRLKKETIEEFELGWAPNEKEALTLHFLNLGFSPEDLVQAGLSLKTERGSQIDRFRGRIMFPIHNHLGKVVGFTGRILPQLDDGKTGKYMNSPETPIFSKSRLLYGFWKSKDQIRESNSAFLVEGQMDFLMSWQAGVKTAVASSGTALTPDHLRALRRLTDRLVLSFDADEAGLAAGERAIDLAESADFEVRVVSWGGKYKDPAEAAQAEPELLKKAVSEAKPAPEFYFERYIIGQPTDMSSRDFLKRLRAVLAKLNLIASPVERSHWLRELSRRTGVEERVLTEEASGVEAKRESVSIAPEAPPPLETNRVFSRRELLSQRLLSAMLANNALDLPEGEKGYLPPEYQVILELLRRGKTRSEDADQDEILNLIILQAQPAEEKEFKELKDYLFREYIKERRRELTSAIKRAESAGDEVALAKSLEEVSKLPVI